MYDGVVTIADDDIPVIVELDETRIRMSAGGTEIGEWPADECQISHVSESTFSISAENETLRFVPNQPRLFAAAVNGTSPEVGPAGLTPMVETPRSEEPQPLPPEIPLDEVPAPETVTTPPTPAPSAPVEAEREAPPPQPLTVGLFYALCVLTAGLAIWSLVTIVF
jgi:hypothetical protein